jgi:hypothetical protein
MLFQSRTYEVNKDFEVVEKQTGRVIRKHDTYQQARKFAKFLSSGGGFNGWTPDFFLITYDINKLVYGS